MTDEEGSGKTLRWQIGGTSLQVLDHVYSLDPFPGLETRKELARQLNVLPRQVQVWFQNKRQRERKISRSLGLFSTPGLPDTPAATAAKTALEKCSSAETAGQPAVKANADSTDGSSGVTTGGVHAVSDSGLGKRRLSGCNALLDAPGSGLPITRAASCPNPDVALLLGSMSDAPMSLDDTAIPAGPVCRYGAAQQGKAKLGGIGVTAGMRKCDAASDTALIGPAAAKLTHVHQSPRSGSGPCELNPFEWFGGSSTSGQSQQSEARCREAVARARAALEGDGPADSTSLALMAQMAVRLPILQSLMPPVSYPLPGLGLPEGVNSLDCSLADLPDDLGRQLAAELLADEPPSDHLEPDATASTVDVLLEQTAASAWPAASAPAPGGPPTACGGPVPSIQSVSLGPSHRPASGWAWVPQPAIKKRAVPRDTAGCPNAKSSIGTNHRPGEELTTDTEQTKNKEHSMGKAVGTPVPGLPLLRSGVSGLLDQMQLDQPDHLKLAAPELATLLGGSGGGGGALDLPLTEAEACMQAAADEYVQVITSAAAPFAIIFASAAWLSLCEFDAQSQVIGETLQLVEGPLTQRQQAERLDEAMRNGCTCALRLTHHTRSGKPFSHDVRLEPLRDSSGKLHCFQATSSNILMLDAQGIRAAALETAEANAAHAAGNSHTDPEQRSEIEQMSMSRSYSGLKIHEMLDLFHASAGRGSTPLASTIESDALYDPFTRGACELDNESAVVSAFLDLA